MVRGTLDQMACGGIRDHVGGGFHRYTVDAAWIVPHFEKMLYDNAQLASLYLEAAAVFDSATYRDVARETLSFLLREMVDVRGGVYASFDADSGGEEGSYYVWTPSELRALAGERDGKILAALLGVTDAGNFDGKSVLTRHVSVRSVAEKFDLEPSEVERLLDAWKPAMIEARAKRVRPGLDRKVVTAWTALAISAFAEGYRLLGDARYLAAAQQASEFLWTAHRKPDGSLYRVSNGGEPSDEGILDDYGNFACALLDLYEATGEVEHVRRAQQLVDLVLEVFTRDDGGFYMTRRGQDAPLGRRFDVFDDVEPSGNSSALHAAHRLSVITGMPKYRTCVDTSLRAIGGFAARAGMELAWWLDVAQLLHGPAYVVVIAGDTGDALTAALERAIHGRLPPQATLVRVPSGGPSAEQRSVIEVARDATATGGRPTAYVCAPGACQLPTTEAAELVRQIMQGWTA
ncbi:MAG: hypothetical protein MUF54_04315, partial [Polyangiaceae bacterium]|nr:hypothetical protein [Polyangiaceae bacterium]